MTKQLALPAAGFRAGLLGSLSMGKEYMDSINGRARMLRKACRVGSASSSVDGVGHDVTVPCADSGERDEY